ncbi:acyltransferase family protein [Synechococcus sp. BA-124 BA4]|uniref:acyltransferase family protein n=1 Tax=unclassified Synechococcus TaxID=2626047 RepID=UPI002AD595CF|nr:MULTISPECIES: acyltransferase family protein [unclassified Synechococcus]MEA5399138.1 acyltransferase family protein [Synechococcus sp. BA-124 BA4]CAK6688298.1 hypothetical protein BBFGKLBO_00386 [Synechococcus sp. CBW1107]
MIAPTFEECVITSEETRLPRSQPRAAGGRYRPEIDGLRAFAVIAVIINHFNKEILPSGYLGVDIFFVISGFVITSSLADRKSKNFGDFLSGFYERRIKRLVPALVVFVLITSVLISLVNPEPQLALGIGQKALFGISNISLFSESADYFSQYTDFNPFAHTWSLGVEEQFYLLFPFLIWFSGFGRQAPNGARNLFLWVGAFSIASLIGFMYYYPINQPAAYFLMPNRFWEMAAGCLIFIGFQKRVWIEQALERVPPLIVVAAMVGVMFLPVSQARAATLSIVALSAVLIACLKHGTAAFKAFTAERVVYIGLISYSLYLWHWGVLAISRWTIGIHWWSVPIQAILILVLAILSYRLIEKPFRGIQVAQGRRPITIIAGLGALLAFSIPVTLAAEEAEENTNHIFLGVKANLKGRGGESLTDEYKIPGTAGRWAGEDCVLSSNDDAGNIIKISDCTLGDFKNAKKRILVIGNSYSASFVEAFDDLVKQDQYAVTITSSWGASPAKEIQNTSEDEETANNYYWNSVIPEMIAKLQPGDIVFSIFKTDDFAPKKLSTEDTNAIKTLEQGIARLSDHLSARGIGFVFLHTLPFEREANCTPDMAIPQWYAPPWSNRCLIPDKEQTLIRRKELDTALARLSKTKKVKVLDLINIFCPTHLCTYVTPEGMILYRDEWGHPSIEAARKSEGLIRKAILEAASEVQR